MAQSIWKDYIVSLGTSSGPGIRFRINVDDAPIYEGKAFPRPGSTWVEVRINDICAEYLRAHFPNETPDHYSQEFEVEVYTDVWQREDIVTFIRDWSYDRQFNWPTDKPFAPITPVLHPMGYLPVWAYNGHYAFDLILAPDSPGDFNDDFNDDFNYFGVESIHLENDEYDGDFYFCWLGEYENLVAVEANGVTYRVADLCGGYVLYYLNAYGGWDAIPVQGRTIRSSNITHHNYDTAARNTYAVTRGRTNFVNEIERRFKFVIGPLTSEQTARMPHLLESPLVYMHDIQRNEVLPIVLTSNAAEVKDVVGNLHTYEVEAVLAQERMRR